VLQSNETENEMLNDLTARADVLLVLVRMGRDLIEGIAL
jgi:hypothetical protein